MIRSALAFAIPFAAALLALGGCISLPRMPVQPVPQDPFAGIDIEKRLPAFPQLNLALLLSENTRNSAAFGRQGAAMGGVDIGPLLESKFAMFKENFKSSVRIDRLADAKAFGADVVALYDSVVSVGLGFSLDITVIFMDAAGKEIERLRARSGGLGGRMAQVVKDTNAALEKDMRASAKLADFARSRGSAAKAAPPPSAPAQSDIDELPPFRARPQEKAYAVVIGVRRYQQPLPEADFADADAGLMKSYLTKVLGYQDANVALLINEQATKSGFEKFLEGWLPNRVEEGAGVFVYFSGHGAPSTKTGEAYLMPYDGDPTYLDKTGYPLKRLYAELAKLSTKKVTVVMDSCFSGAGGKSVLAKGARPLISVSVKEGIPAGITVLSASAGDQISYTYHDRGHGLFTYFFLKGLKMQAGREALDLKAVFDYAAPQVAGTARREYNADQVPQWNGPPDR